MVDGSAVNHVARLYCEGHLRDIYERTDQVGSDDLMNFEHGLRQAVPSFAFLHRSHDKLCVQHGLQVL